MLAGASAAQVAVALSIIGLPAIGPDLREAYGLSLPALGALLTAVILGSGAGLIPAGVLVDRLGSRPVLVAGTVLGAGAMSVAALADSGLVVGVAIAVSGLGSAAVPVAGAGALFRVYPQERRGWALGVRQTAVPLGGVLGAVAMPLLVKVGGTELVFAASAVALGATGAAFAVVLPPETGGAPTRLALGTVWRAPGMRHLLAVAACYIVVLSAVVTYLVPSTRDAGLSAFAAGAAYVLLNLTAALARIVWGRIADGHGGTRRSRTLVEAGCVAAAGAVVFTLAEHVGLVAVIPAVVVFGFGALGWNALVYVSAGERVVPQLAGQAFALAATVVFLVGAIVTPLLGLVADWAGWDAFWLTTGAIALLGAAISARVPPRLPSV